MIFRKESDGESSALVLDCHAFLVQRSSSLRQIKAYLEGDLP